MVALFPLSAQRKTKVRVLPRFPARVEGGAGIEVTRSSGVYAFNLRFDNLIPVAALEAADKLVLQREDGSFAYIASADMPSGGGGGDMLAATYDPQSIADDAFDRANHTGTQAISTISATGTPSASTFLRGDGSWATPAGSGDVSKVGTPVNNQIGVWTGDGTLEGDTALTFDTSTDTLAIAASGKLAFGAVNILSDSSGTMTLSNIDALDATTESTIEAAIDTLANLTSIQGLAVTLADAGADALLGWDDSASAYQNLSASDARAALALGTAAVKNTGTSGDAVPLLNVANTFSAQQIFSLSSAFALPAQFVSTDAGSSGGPYLYLLRDSASPAANDDIGAISFRGKDSAGGTDAFAEISSRILDHTSGSEDGRMSFGTVVAGTFSTRLVVGAGLYNLSATGGDKGDNTINFGAIYDDNSLLTCMALAKEFLEAGKVDLEKWDAMVPDQIQPEERRAVRVFEKRSVKRVNQAREKDGSITLRIIEREEEVPVLAWTPIYDAEGNGLDAIEEPVVEEIVRPAAVIKREHRTARIFKAMCASGFDPRDPEPYFAKMRADEALPGMPTQADWEHNALSMGEQFSRKWLAIEMLAIVCNVMWGKIKEHETRIASLETRRGIGR